MAEIKGLFIKPQKGSEKVPCREFNLIEDKGVEGDVFAKGGERQVSLLYAQTVEESKKLADKQICLQKFSPNIIISGGIPKSFHAGTVIYTNNISLIVTQIGRKCHEICGERSCPLIGGAIFAKVLKGGKLKAGEEIFYE